jgi:uncharacterized protein YcsI (UPF0317 family)
MSPSPARESVFGPGHTQGAAQVRRIIRAGHWGSHTSGLAPQHVQGNLVILPEALASDFLRFCHRNPQACPLLAVSEPGAANLPELGSDLDVRTDVPRYRVFRAGALVAEPTDVLDLWRSDLVTFVLGCSFSFEWALLQAGIGLRHIEQGKNVAMYRTNVAVVPAGAFAGPLVVSMRPLRAREAIRAVQVTSRFPQLHGAPIHIGSPELLGIADLARPDYGDSVEPRSDELPVFWACGVTPQAALERARPELCITHYPGAMLVTDLENARVASF